MPQVHPLSSILSPHVCIDQNFCSRSSTHFTVWTKSLLFNGKGFTVFDSMGHLVFRVDNYASNVRNEVLLMDDAGQLLLTIRRKKWSFRKSWEAFKGDPVESDKPKFSLQKSFGFSNKTTASVFIKRKEAKSDIMLGNDVLSLVVEAGVDQAFVMALLIIFNQIS
ncbi:hypothetical protein SUGI_1091430 [Cryptomeria japonica]|nr:hypothetical protein SUGI_1091430 [Cryptomeria japonica]